MGILRISKAEIGIDVSKGQMTLEVVDANRVRAAEWHRKVDEEADFQRQANLANANSRLLSGELSDSDKEFIEAAAAMYTVIQL